MGAASSTAAGAPAPQRPRLGSRLASFVALLEVVSAVVLAWILLDELPRGIQLAGGALVRTGVVVVRAGERAAPPAPSATA